MGWIAATPQSTPQTDQKKAPGEIPIGDARAIAERRQCPLIIIFGLTEGGAEFQVTTYGMSKKLCRLAASLGEQFAQAILEGTLSPPLEELRHLPETPQARSGHRWVSTHPGKDT